MRYEGTLVLKKCMSRVGGILLLLCTIFTLLASVFLHTKTATAATSNTINFQARLMGASGAIVPDGFYNVEFKLYNAASSSGSSQGSCTGDANCLWTETRTGGNTVRVANGYLTANLGSVTAFPGTINWDQELWLSMNIGGTSGPTWDGPMTPRLKLTAVPYAFRAGQLAKTSGAFTSTVDFVQPTANNTILMPDASGTVCLQASAACGFVTGSPGDYIQNQNSTNQTANFRISGTARANTGVMTPLLQPTVDGTTAFKIQNIAGTITPLAVDTTNGRVAIGANTAAEETLDVIGNLQVRDAITDTKSYRLRTSGGALDLEGSGANLHLSIWSGAGYTGTQYNQIVFKSDGSSMDFARGFNVSDAAARVGLGGNVNPQYALDVTGDINTSTQYRIGGTVICTASGCTPAAGSANYIQNQNSGDQTANFRIDGTGRAGTALQAPLFDTATATTLNVGTTNATAINLNKSTTITGAITQSGGVISLTGNGVSQVITTSNNALNIRAGGTAVLTLNTSGAGTVNVGTDNTTTVNIGGGNDVARTIRVGDPQSAGTAAQTVTVGSQRTSSSTTIQGGNGSAAIALNTASGGNINLTTLGTGTINLTTGSAGVIVKPTTDNGAVFQVQAAGGGYLFNVNTFFGIVNIGLLNIGIGTNTALIDATNSGDTISIGTANASTINLGRTAAAVTIQGSSASTFKATSGSFTSTLGFITPTANRTINLPNESGTICLQASTACGFVAGTAAGFIQNTTTLQNANIAVQAATSGTVTAVLQANAAGTADILSLRNGAGTAVASFGYNGQVLLRNSTNSATAFQVQNAGGTAVLLVDTTNQRVAIGNTAPALKFEVQGGDAAIYNNGNNARLVLGDNSTTGQYGWLQWDSANDYFRIETSGSNGLKIKDNYVSIGNIFPSKPLIVGNGTNALFEVGATGQIQARTSTDAVTAFQLQDSTSDVYFNADSINSRIGIGAGMVTPEVTLDVAGAIQQTGLVTSNSGAADNNKWTKLGTCTLTAQFSQCLTKLEIIGGSDGSTGNNGQATVAVRVKQQNAMGGVPYVNVTLNDTAEIITKSDIVAVTTVNNGTTTTVELYGRITNTFESWYYTPVMNTGAFGQSTWDWSPLSPFVAALPGGTQQPARFGNVNANLLSVEATNLTAVKIQNAGAANTLFVADTTNMRIGIGQATAAYTLDVLGDINTSTQLRIAGTSICDATGCVAKTGSGFYIHNQLTAQASNFWVQAATTGTVAGVLQAFNGGTGAILQLKNGAGTNVAVFGSAGAVSLQNSTNSTTAFQVSAAAGGGGNSILRVDSTNERVAIGVISDPISAKLSVATSTSAAVRAYQAGAFDALQLANATGDIFNVTQTGRVLTKTTTNSATAFQIQNSSGVQVFSVDTVDNIMMLGTGFGGKHVAIDIETNPYIELVDSTGKGVSLIQIEGGNGFLYHDNDLLIQRVANSPTDLQVLDASDTAQFTVDTTNSQIEIGTSDTIGTTLVLDTKTNAGDPTGVNGAMYYNSNMAKFRCYQGGVWTNCINGTMNSYINVGGSTGLTKTPAAAIVVTPFYIPGRITVNEMRVGVTTVLGAAGDIGIYDSTGTRLLSGGASSVTTAIGGKAVAPTQTGTARILEPGQYYMAVTWNSTTGAVGSAPMGGAVLNRNGILSSGGGTTLPASITIGSISNGTGVPAFGIND